MGLEVGAALGRIRQVQGKAGAIPARHDYNGDPRRNREVTGTRCRGNGDHCRPRVNPASLIFNIRDGGVDSDTHGPGVVRNEVSGTHGNMRRIDPNIQVIRALRDS